MHIISSDTETLSMRDVFLNNLYKIVLNLIKYCYSFTTYVTTVTLQQSVYYCKPTTVPQAQQSTVNIVKY